MLRGEKMAALGRMAVGIAADFRNKLNVVQGNLELARAEPAPSEGLQDTISEIETATRSMAALVEELVVFGRGSDGERRLTSWNEIVRGSKAMLRRVVPASIAIDITLGNELGSVEADPSQLEQVVASLVLNACDSLGASGKVQVSTCAVGEGGAQWSELAVRDNGPGMDAARRERIFEPFFSSRGESRGLGLATVHAIAARQGGQVDVESSPGGGTCFRVRLPRVSP
jgi:signal transduction histidine kinase